jgi:Domain of unknown function (DUF4389)
MRGAMRDGGKAVVDPYPATFSVDYPDRPLDRFSTFFRIFAAVPILVLLSAVGGSADNGRNAAAGGILVGGPLLMILFRQKYPRWWFDWNVELSRFSYRVFVYLALMDDRYPSTDDQQSVHLELVYPDAMRLSRWLVLVKWFLAIPHFLVLVFLGFAALVATVVAWLVILFTQRYPRGIFTFNEGVMRWGLRVTAYAVILTTDRYPPFRLGP